MKLSFLSQCARSALIIISLIFPHAVFSQETVCAEVKIEIAQELTIERQAFEATLLIENTLVDKTLNNINVVVEFKDQDENTVIASSDPNDTTASFFIRVNSLDGISSVSGSGSLDGGQTAKATWLIIPAPGASDGISSGKLYFVGARFEYTLDGIADSIEVAPDTIYVKPMPLLSLDYFLPRDVFADDPLTTEIESPEPFTLGIRIRNNGSGTGKNIKIESAKPEIVENDQGLLIGFRLLNSQVQNESVNNSLLLNFGDIESTASKVGRWTMETSLSGRFKDFEAEYSHADELGGQLTSLLEGVNTHTLVRDVLVDLPGRDDVRDFLAYDVFDSNSGNLGGLQVYESDSVTTSVSDYSNSVSFDDSGSGYRTLSFSSTTGFAYAQMDDPFTGAKQANRVVRSDGKVLSPNNYWFSKSYDRTSKEISYHFNLFDANTTGEYKVYLGDVIVAPRAPNIQFIPLKTTFEGNNLGFLVEASDPDGTIPVISSTNLPAGASLTDQANGTALFSWTPDDGQANTYEVEFIASDGTLSSSRKVVIRVNSASDTDGDGMLDSWEVEQFGNLDRDGLGDADEDGVTDLDEFERGTDPNVSDGPLAPVILSPGVESMVATKRPELIIQNSEYVGSYDIVYAYEVFSDDSYSTLVDAYYAQPQGTESDETIWQPKELEEDKIYYWRVRAFDSFTYSPWVNGSFRVNTENTLPEKPVLISPETAAEVFIDQLVLSVSSVVDVDGDDLFYQFSVANDEQMTDVVVSSDQIAIAYDQQASTTQVDWTVPEDAALTEAQAYFWQVSVVDVSGEPVLSATNSFYLGISNTPPAVPEIISPEQGVRVEIATPQLVVNDAVDADENDTLSYLFEVDTVSTFDSANKLSSNWLTDNEAEPTFAWDVSSELNEDTVYYWRVKARDAEQAESAWSVSSFVVNAENQPPLVPVIKNPGDTSQVVTLTPTLEVFAVTDPDQDQVRYAFELYQDAALTELLASTESDQPQWLLSQLDDDKWYYWRAKAVDEKNESSAWSAAASFFVNENNVDNPPEFTWLVPVEGTEIIEGNTITLRWQDKDDDSSATIELYYANNPEGVDRVQIAADIAEDSDGSGDEFTWSSAGLDAGDYYFFAVISDETSIVPVSAESVFSVSVAQYKPRPIKVKSVSGDSWLWSLGKLIDHHYYTFWRYGPYKQAEIVFEFEELRRLDVIEMAYFLPRLHQHRYSLYVSTDENNWQPIVEDQTSSKHFWTKEKSFDAVDARYVKLVVHEAYLRIMLLNKFKIHVIKRINEVMFKGGEPLANQ